MFARRMEILAQSGATVLALGEALRLLQQGKLPPNSVAITFDDGWADFRTASLPGPAKVWLSRDGVSHYLLLPIQSADLSLCAWRS